MALVQIHPNRVVQLWPYLKQGIEESGQNPETILMTILANRIDVHLSENPNIWFFAGSHRADYDKGFKMYYILSGWALDKMPRSFAKAAHGDLHLMAKHNHCDRILFNDRSPFLKRFLSSVGGDLWQTVR